MSRKSVKVAEKAKTPRAACTCGTGVPCCMPGHETKRSKGNPEACGCS